MAAVLSTTPSNSTRSPSSVAQGHRTMATAPVPRPDCVAMVAAPSSTNAVNPVPTNSRSHSHSTQKQNSAVSHTTSAYCLPKSHGPPQIHTSGAAPHPPQFSSSSSSLQLDGAANQSSVPWIRPIALGVGRSSYTAKSRSPNCTCSSCAHSLGPGPLTLPALSPAHAHHSNAHANAYPAGIPRSRLFYTTAEQGPTTASALGLSSTLALSSLDLPLSHSHSFSHPHRSANHSRSHSHDSVFDDNDLTRAAVMASYALYSGHAPAAPTIQTPHGYRPNDHHHEFHDEEEHSDSDNSFLNLDEEGLCLRYRRLHDLDAVAAPNASTLALRARRSYGSSFSCSSGRHLNTEPSQAYNDSTPKHYDDNSLPPPMPPRPTENTASESSPFHKWMRTLQRRAEKRPQPIGYNAPWKLLDLNNNKNATSIAPSPVRSTRRLSDASDASSDFVGATKTASISVASTRISPSCQSVLSADSIADRPTFLEDDFHDCHDGTSVWQSDPAARERAIHRRRILDELTKTEEGYIGDMRFLMNVYITLLAGLPTLPMGLRQSINHNLTAIIELHEEILEELYRVVPRSDYYSLESNVASPEAQKLYGESGSVPWGISGNSTDAERVFAEAQITEEVAKIFTRKMSRFFIYKEYGAKYEMMVKDVSAAHRTIPEWDSYQKGLETLASSLGPASHCEQTMRKALTIRDLLVKPIQRACRYPLIFSELLKYTPNEDCPNSHMAVEEALIRLREATAEINRATTDVRIKTTLEQTWILQDRLVFANHRLDAVSKNRVRSFGHIKLCGTLHACWQTKDSAEGQYMICLLYNDVLCLASASKADQIYTIQACIPLCNLKLEEADNGRGIQCHTAPFSWKLVFEHDSQLFEIILTACSPKEELEWRSRFSSPEIGIDGEKANLESAHLSFLALPIKSLGAVFGKPGTVTHRISIQRASTIGPKNHMCQVILKNTCVLREAKSPTKSPIKSPSGPSINRSQSLISNSSNNGNNHGCRIAMLSPPRGERARLESMLSDIWSRDILPFPGMTARARSEHVMRATTSSMIRRLSVASITSTFSRRTGSHASVTRPGITGMTTSPTSIAASLSPGTSPMFDESVTIIHNMTRRSIDMTSTTCPVFDDGERKSGNAGGSSQLPTITDEIDRKPLRRMTLPVSPPRFTMRDFWSAGEDGTDDSDVLSSKVCSPLGGSAMDTGAEVIGDEDVLLMRSGKSLSSSRQCSCSSLSSGEDGGFIPMSTMRPGPIQTMHPLDTGLSPILSPILSPRRAFEDMDVFGDRLKLSEEYGRESSLGMMHGDDGTGTENMDDGDINGGSPTKRNTMSRRMSKRWSASSGKHRDSMVSGIRSLFR